jgi:hypothetical protein
VGKFIFIEYVDYSNHQNISMVIENFFLLNLLILLSVHLQIFSIFVDIFFILLHSVIINIILLASYISFLKLLLFIELFAGCFRLNLSFCLWFLTFEFITLKLWWSHLVVTICENCNDEVLSFR